jgi:hypothetical protein
MSRKPIDSNHRLDFFANERGLDGRHYLSLDRREDLKVSIRPNKDVSPGKFRSDPLLPGGYIAHPTTIAALRVDIFVAGEDFVDLLEDWVTCHRCNETIDKQFWKFCPHCEAAFLE